MLGISILLIACGLVCFFGRNTILRLTSPVALDAPHPLFDWSLLLIGLVAMTGGVYLLVAL